MARPLAGIRILDLSQVIAGPYGPALLTHAGAECIKVEPLWGDISQTFGGSFYSLNHGKRSIALDLRLPAAQAIVHKLAAESDVLVQNFRPGVIDRLNCSYDAFAKVNPRLIYVRSSAFGATGPYIHRPGYDPLLQAMTGIESAQGGRHNPPVFLRIAITDYATALQQAAAVTMALYARERTGRGQVIDLSLLRTGIFINGDAFTRYAGRPARLLPDAGQHGLGPLDRIYRTADGWIFLLVEADQERWHRLLRHPSFAALAADYRFATATARNKHEDELAAALELAFGANATSAWLAELGGLGVPCAPVIENYSKELFEDVQPIVNGYIIHGEHPERGYVELPGNFIRYSRNETNLEGRAAPMLGQHTDEVLREIGYDDREIEKLRLSKVVG